MLAGRSVSRSRPSVPARSTVARHRAPRKLAFESLDVRCLLSATPVETIESSTVEVTEICQPEVQQVTASDVQLVAAADQLAESLGPVFPAETQDVPVQLAPQPLAAPAPLDGAEGEDPMNPPPLGSGDPITALEITEFQVSVQPSGWYLTGKVAITGSYSPSLQVKLGGLLQGKFALVNSSGDFSYYWAPPHGVVGDVSAQAIAGTVFSNVAWVSVV